MAKTINPPGWIEQGYIHFDFFRECMKIFSQFNPEPSPGQRHVDLIKIQDEKQDTKLSRALGYYFGEDKVDCWEFLSGQVPDNTYKSASAFYTTHDCDNLRRLFNNVGKILVPGGLLFIVDYNLRWIRALESSLERRESFEKWFNLGNEKKELDGLEKALRHTGKQMCYETHTRYGLRDYTSAGKNAGFRTVKAHSLPEKTPKIFLYAGIKQGDSEIWQKTGQE